MHIEYSHTILSIQKKTSLVLYNPLHQSKGIQAFKETAPETSGNDSQLRPDKLFMHFTADIIKKDVIFIR